MNIEQFVNDYLQEHRHDVLLNPYNGLVEFATVFKKEMFKDVVEGEVESFTDMHQEVTIPLNPTMFKVGDKVRIIILPKEERK